MKRSTLLLVSVLFFALMAFLWWHVSVRDADLTDILQRSDLGGTSVSYSWTGGFSFGNSDVHAMFSGNGEATLQVGDKSPIRISLSEERYRSLLKCLSDNKFTEIKVRRRWGQYLCDIGLYEELLKDGSRSALVYADEKHYVDSPE